MAETSPEEVKIVVEPTPAEEEKEERPKSVIKIDKFCFNAEQLAQPSAEYQNALFDWQGTNGGTKNLNNTYGGIEGLAECLGTDLNNGLTTADAKDPKRIDSYGSNKNEQRKPVSYCSLVKTGCEDFTVIALTVAGIFSIITGMIGEGPELGWLDGTAIIIAVLIVVNVGAINDWQKDRQFIKLSAENAKSDVTVIRDGVKQTILIDDLVVGDILYISGGNTVPVDAIYVSGDGIKMDESKLTGEPDQLKKDHEHPFIVSSSECFDGKMTCLVTAVGHNSVYGKMRELIEVAHERTPLQLKLEHLTGVLSIVGAILCTITVIVMVIVHVVNYAKGNGTVDEEGNPEWTKSNWSQLIQFVIAGIAVLVVAIPEGMPLAVTIALAYSVKRMMKDNNLVRHLNACETMGGANNICSDKTGTLTQGKMTVMQGWFLKDTNDQNQTIFLNKYVKLTREERDEFIQSCKDIPNQFRELVIEDSILNNDGFIDKKEGKEVPVGSPLDIALINWCRELGIEYTDVRKKFPLLDSTSSTNKEDKSVGIVSSYPFHSNRKRSSVAIRLPNGKYRVYVKGAPDMLLRLSKNILIGTGVVQELTGFFVEGQHGTIEGEGTRRVIMENCIAKMARTGLRVIALAYRDFDDVPDWKEMKEYDVDEQKGVGNCPVVEEDLTFLMLVGVQDPVRPEVPGCVELCQKAGIKVRMVTGDSMDTAQFIAKQCHILKSGGLRVTGAKFRDDVGGLVLPPHFEHECHCQDLSNDPAFKKDWFSPPQPVHYHYPAIVGHKDDAYCCNWTTEAISARGGITKCTDECKQRGCRYQMSDKDKKNKSAENKYLVVKNQYIFDNYLHNLQVMARSAPTDKHLLVSGLMERGQVVAVTGDGTNDGPALAKSNVGFAMGISGTSIAKEACDIILMDDNFASIVKAVKWGRNVYDNMRRFLQFQLSAAYSALCMTFICACVINESPLTAVQILWFSLIIDTCAGLALATEYPTDNLLDRPPYQPEESIISKIIFRNIASHSIYQFIVVMFLIFKGHDIFGVPCGIRLGHGAAPTVHKTIVFHAFILMQLFNEINSRKINNEWNVFDGVFTNLAFVGMVVLETGLQFVIIEIGGRPLMVTGLNGVQHGMCILIGFMEFIVAQLSRLVPADWFMSIGSNESTKLFEHNFLVGTRSKLSSRLPGMDGMSNGAKKIF